ncbi:MAG: hypothetical protein AB7S38_33680 [Vulcanimicrobiota bacterium]
MIRLSKNATDAQIVEAVEQWVRLLAAGDYRGAFELTDHGPDDHLTPEVIRTLIRNYGSIEPMKDGSVYRVTEPREAVVVDVTPRPQIERFSDGPPDYLGYVHYDLPLNGRWSDLTAVFTLTLAECGALTLALDEIHVL